MARRLTPRGTRRRAELVDYATRAFAANGYHATSVDSIVDGLGVGKGVFYWYFSSKEDLLRELLTAALRSMRLAQREAIAGEHDPARRIEQGIRASLLWLAEHRDLVMLMEFARLDERFAPFMRLGDQQMVADAQPHVSAGITAGLLRGEDPVVLTMAIVGVTSHLARTLVLERGEDPERVARVVIAFCRQGYLSDNALQATRTA
jgi:AcrR family transcriptional regulator